VVSSSELAGANSFVCVHGSVVSGIVKAQRLLAHRGGANSHPKMRASHYSSTPEHTGIEESIQYNAAELWKSLAPLSALVCVTDERLPCEEGTNNVRQKLTRRRT
jgi:hypothetical protein